MKIYFAFVVASILVSLAVYAVIAYVAVHFIHKLW